LNSDYNLHWESFSWCTALNCHCQGWVNSSVNQGRNIKLKTWLPWRRLIRAHCEHLLLILERFAPPF